MEGILHLTQDLPRPGLSCPDEATLASYIDGAVDSGQRARIEAHVSKCQHCLAQVGFALGLRGEELPPVPQALIERVQSRPSQRALSSGWRWATAAAVAACALVAGLVVNRETAAPAPVQMAAVQQQSPAAKSEHPLAPEPRATVAAVPIERGERSRTAPSIDMLEPQSGAVLEQSEIRFRWTKAPAALYYRIRVATADGNLVWDSENVEHESALLPPAVRLTAGRQYFVWVRAYMSAGKTVDASATSFTVVAGPTR